MTASPTNRDAEHPLDSGESGENLSVAASVADVHLHFPMQYVLVFIHIVFVVLVLMIHKHTYY